MHRASGAAGYSLDCVDICKNRSFVGAMLVLIIGQIIGDGASECRG